MGSKPLGEHTEWTVHDMVFTFCDTFRHLNTLNLEVQGQEKSNADLVEKLCAFTTILTIFTTDLTAIGLLHFPQLRAFINSKTRWQNWLKTLVRDSKGSAFPLRYCTLLVTEADFCAKPRGNVFYWCEHLSGGNGWCAIIFCFKTALAAWEFREGLV